MLEHLNEILDSTQITTSTAAVRLAISFVLGAIIGAERQFRRRDAGMRTFTLICMGSAAAMLISIWIPQTYPNFLNGDPGRIAPKSLQVLVSWEQELLFKVMEACMDSLRRLVFG